jgi:hypothetical protein
LRCQEFACSVRTTKCEELHGCHLVDYNTNQLEWGLRASKHHGAIRLAWCIEAILQAYMTNSSSDEE